MAVVQQNSRSSSSVSTSSSSTSSVASVSAVSMPAVSMATIQRYQDQQHVISSSRKDLVLPAARPVAGASSHQGEGLAQGPVGAFQSSPLQMHGWEVQNGPVSQIMRAVGNAVMTLLKLIFPKKPI